MAVRCMPTPQVRTLRLAAETLGGEAHLAQALGVSSEQLARWLNGDTPPLEVYMAALDFVARGPHGEHPGGESKHKKGGHDR